jgi:hypothetical protein
MCYDFGMSATVKQILEDLAAGTISPEEAGRRIDESKAEAAASIERVLVRGSGRQIHIVADEQVAAAAVEGPHLLSQEADTLVIEGDHDLGVRFDGFSLHQLQRTFEDIRDFGNRRALYIRMNPRLALDLDITGANVNCSGIPRLDKIRLTAANGKFTGFTHADDVLIVAGAGELRGTVREGRSRVRVESGQVTLELGPDSDVSVKSDVQLGKITVDYRENPTGDNLTIGTGTARLDLSVIMGNANVIVGGAK